MIEYPKMLYRGSVDAPEEMVVDSSELEALALADGWELAATFYHYPADPIPQAPEPQA